MFHLFKKREVLGNLFLVKELGVIFVRKHHNESYHNDRHIKTVMLDIVFIEHRTSL